MRVLLLNSVLNYGSTGRIVEQICHTAFSLGWDSVAIHGSKYHRDSSQVNFQIGNRLNTIYHEINSFLFDKHGLLSIKPTRELLDLIDSLSPDIIHLHNIHGYWLNYPILFDYFSRITTPIVWTLHDCWPFTGHCSYFDRVNCEKWKTHCCTCPGLKVYPRSLFDNSSNNFEKKYKAFTSIVDRLTIVPVSFWLESFIKESFLREAQIHTIHNGVDTSVFEPKDTTRLRTKLGIGDKKTILGVASPWVPRKGLTDMINLSKELDNTDYQVIVVGVSEQQQKNLPESIIGIQRTDSSSELAEYYSLAEAFVNPTYEDNFPTTNLEAISCGTPVVTYRTGGSPEAIDSSTGIVLEQGDFSSLLQSVKMLDKKTMSNACRQRAINLFDKTKCYQEYISLYESLL